MAPPHRRLLELPRNAGEGGGERREIEHFSKKEKKKKKTLKNRSKGFEIIRRRKFCWEGADVSLRPFLPPVSLASPPVLVGGPQATLTWGSGLHFPFLLRGALPAAHRPQGAEGGPLVVAPRTSTGSQKEVNETATANKIRSLKI